VKGCVISAAMTGAGKTTITLGLLAALRRRGFDVQPFKVGPDFIDPGLHRLASGIPSHNLDGWMLNQQANERLFAMATAGKDSAIVEGMMGLFDGFDGRSESGSTAEMARWLGLKVVLVVDASGLGRSIAAIVRGIRDYDPHLDFAGVILNRVGGAGHFEILKDALDGFPILGWLPSEPAIEIPERHLGLMTAAESLPEERIQRIAEFLERHLDIPRLILALETEPSPGASRRPLPEGEGSLSLSSASEASRAPLPPGEVGPKGRVRVSRPRVALAYDKAFSFYYEANRLELEANGAEIVEFSPLSDRAVPEADLLYIGGGYPELYRDELAANTPMLESVRAYIRSGRRFYAECGGLMYLSESIDHVPMVGILPTRIEMTSRPVNFGYCDLTTGCDSILGPAETHARGHQFHYSEAKSESPESLYRVHQRTRDYQEGFVLPNGVASYVHLHFLSNPQIACNLLHF
jgi:cobyrinic acid a,c-diamide synthase